MGNNIDLDKFADECIARYEGTQPEVEVDEIINTCDSNCEDDYNCKGASYMIGSEDSSMEIL